MRRTAPVIVIPALTAALTAAALSLLATESFEATATVVVADESAVSTDAAVAATLEARAEVGAEPEVEISSSGADVDFTVSSSNEQNAIVAANLLAGAYADSIDATLVEASTASTSGESVLPTVVLALLAGALVGIIAAVVVTTLDPTIRSARQLARVTRAPTLGTIPYRVTGSRRRGRAVMLRNPDSSEAEAYRSARTALDFVLQHDGRKDDPDPSTEDGRTAHVVMITSARPGEGKSTVCANLAIAAALAGDRVVLIDADLRKPQLHRLLNLDNDIGLTSIVGGTARVSEAIHRPDPPGGLAVITSGPPQTDPAEQLARADLDRLIPALKQAADLVLIDVPPVLPVTDATIIGQHADCALLVGRATVTSRREVAASINRLETINVPIAGTVFVEAEGVEEALPEYRYRPAAQRTQWWVGEVDSPSHPGAQLPGPAGEQFPEPAGDQSADTADVITAETSAEVEPDAEPEAEIDAEVEPEADDESHRREMVPNDPSFSPVEGPEHHNGHADPSISTETPLDEASDIDTSDPTPRPEGHVES